MSCSGKTSSSTSPVDFLLHLCETSALARSIESQTPGFPVILRFLVQMGYIYVSNIHVVVLDALDQGLRDSESLRGLDKEGVGGFLYLLNGMIR